MSWFHLIFGAVLFYVFTVTGNYMRADFPDKDIIAPELRMLMRSRHIYILLSSLLHLLLGAYIQMASDVRVRLIQFTGSGLLVISSVVYVAAFCLETYEYVGFSEVSRFAIYLSLAGVGVHLVGGMANRQTKS
jgi:hypothetical protein